VTPTAIAFFGTPVHRAPIAFFGTPVHRAVVAFSGMSVRRAVVAIASGLAAIVVVAGCASPPEVVGPDGSPSPTRAERRAAEKAQRALDAAEVAAARGHLDEADEAYREALAVWPDDPRVLAGLVRVSIARGAFEAAIELDDRLQAAGEPVSRSLAPRERCTLWLDAARARGEAGRSDADALLDRFEAQPACDARAASPVRAEVLARRAEVASAGGETQAAIESWRAAVAADPARVDLEILLARALLDEGLRLEAVERLGESLAHHPDEALLQGLMLEALGVPAGSSRAAPSGASGTEKGVGTSALTGANTDEM